MSMKTILSILFLFVCAFAHAQYHNVEGIRVVGRSDSTTISNVGQIQFDADDDKFRFNDGKGWFSFLKQGTTLPYWKTSGFTPLDDMVQITLPFDLSGDADSLSIRSEASLGPAAFATWFVDETNLLYYLRLGVDLNAPVARYLKFNADYTGAEGTVFFHEVGGTKTGIQYYDYDSTAWTSSTLTTKGYVDGKFDGIQVPEGANKTMGIATLSSGTVTVNTTAVTANSRIFLTVNGGTLTNVGTPYVSARSPGTSFTITSTNASDASDVAWLIIEPAP
jgi:hypothetical protein